MWSSGLGQPPAPPPPLREQENEPHKSEDKNEKNKRKRKERRDAPPPHTPPARPPANKPQNRYHPPQLPTRPAPTTTTCRAGSPHRTAPSKWSSRASARSAGRAPAPRARSSRASRSTP